MEIILQHATNLEMEDREGKLSLVFSRMLSRIREQRLPSLFVGDLNKCRGVSVIIYLFIYS